jgi:hypothetical protein
MTLRDVWSKRCQIHGVGWCKEDLCKLAAFDEYMNVTDAILSTADSE